MKIDKLLYISSYAGKIILENGGETYRVEETICRICRSFGLDNVDSFVTPTGMMISVTDTAGNTKSLVKRIHSRTVNLEKVSKVNELSRNILNENLSLDYIEMELFKIENMPCYSHKLQIFISGIAAGFFTLILGANYTDFLISMLIGALIKTITIIFTGKRINLFFVNITGGALATLLALIFAKFNLTYNIDKIVIGSIMLLVPGLAITNALRDVIEGDLVSGVARAMEALFIALAIAIGTGLVFKLWQLSFGGLNL